METVFLSNTGVKVSRLGFGTMTFGTDADEATSKKLFNRCRDAGINFFDCSDVYGKGKAEEILGRLISDCRNDLIITTKVFFQTRDDMNAVGASRRHIMESVESSLRQLGTDRIFTSFTGTMNPQTWKIHFVPSTISFIRERYCMRQPLTFLHGRSPKGWASVHNTDGPPSNVSNRCITS